MGKKAVRQFTRWVACRTDGIIAPSEKIAALLRGYDVPCPLYVILTGIAMPRGGSQQEARSLGESLGISHGQTVLLYLGRLAKEKSCGELLHAMTRFRDLPVTLLLVGDGPERKALEKLSLRLRLDGQVVFAGMVPPDQVGRWYQLADLFVSASTSETQGLTYMEALHAGAPLLCRQDACLDGVVTQGVNGWQYTGEAEFAAWVEDFSRHPECREHMKKAALASGQRFSTEAFGAQVESAYVRCLHARCRKERGSA